MHYSLIIQYPYESIDIALCLNGSIIDFVSLHKFDAVAKTIPSIQNFLKSKNLKLSDIAFIASNVGPGPYNTLRALLTMLNGIHTVNQVPLIKLNALDLISEEVAEKNYLIALNAFENHIFYKIQNSTQVLYGATSISQLLEIINAQTDTLVIQGNSALKYREKFEKCNKIVLSKKLILFNNLMTLAASSYAKFIKNDFSSEYLKPIYFEDLATNKQ